jgi:hypothetical protein
MTKGPHSEYRGSSEMGSHRARSAPRKAKNPQCIGRIVDAKTGRERRCKNRSMSGSDYCYTHDPRPNKGYAPGYGPMY